PVYSKNAAIYGADKPYPESPVEVSPRTVLRGVDAVTLRLTPFQYNPASKQLTVYRNLRVRVSFTGGNGRFGDDRLRSRWWDPILAGNLLNYRSLPEIDYTQRTAGGRDGYEYVIICPNEANCLAWADTIRQWRTLQGISTNVYTTDVVGPSAQQIETWINNAYNTWSTPPVAVLLIGDVPGQGFSVDTLTADYNSVYYEIFPSDNLYADVDGDHLPDINVARIEADVAGDLPTMINKMLDLERNPYTSAGFYNNPISCVGYQSDRWFQLAGEVVYGFWKNHQGKAPKREYYSTSAPSVGAQWSTNANTPTVIDYFGNPSHGGLGYINDTIPPGISWNTTYSLINADINAGCFIVNHRDHGSETGWADPSYSQANALALTNDMFPFLFTINCLTGAYQQSGSYGQCLGEAFYRQGHGVVGYVGPTEVSYSFVNDAFIWGIYDAMWPDFCPDLGDTFKFHDRGQKPGFAHVFGKLFLAASSWPYNPAEKNITYDLFHMHGDPFLTIYSEMPQDLTVS
ncbi:hypothetical protein EG831_08985, partial [bacterium]|nr:hypothetical protein [bacterium]